MAIFSGPEVTYDHITVGENEVILFTVKNGLGRLGVTKVNMESNGSELSCFYAQDEPILTMSSYGGEYDDMTVVNCGSISQAQTTVKSLDQAYGELCSGAPLESTMTHVMRMLCDGLYAVSYQRVYPTDGESMFFWSGYGMPKQLKCSGKYINLIPKNKSYSAPFILPALSPTGYLAKNVREASETALRGDELIGISYHLSGFYSVLLKGHYAACASVVDDKPFYTVQIQPVRDIWKKTDEDGNEVVAGLACASCRLPFELLSREHIRAALTSRASRIPDAYELIKAKLALSGKGGYKSLPQSYSTFCESYPDAEMIASAQGLDQLTPDMLQALLSGSTTIDDKVIISENYYASVTAACNYLRYHSTDDFISFALEIMKNPELSATYSFVAQSMARIPDKRVKAFFEEVIDSNDSGYSKIISIARSYVDNYEAHKQQPRTNIYDEKVVEPAFKRLSLKDSAQKISANGADLIAKHVSKMVDR